MSPVAVFDKNTVSFYHHLRDITAAVVPMCEGIGDNLPENCISSTYSLDTIQNELVVEMLLPEFNHPVI